MGIGDEPVDPSIGRFIVTQHYSNTADPTKNTIEEIEIQSCSKTESASTFEQLKYKDSLYCLTDYSQYQIKGILTEAEIYNLKISFIVCDKTTNIKCDPDPNEYLQRLTFHFPLMQSSFDPEDNSSMISDHVDEDLVYPFLLNQMMRTTIYIKTGIVLNDNDFSGISKLVGQQQKDRFTMV